MTKDMGPAGKVAGCVTEEVASGATVTGDGTGTDGAAASGNAPGSGSDVCGACGGPGHGRYGDGADHR